MAPRAKTLAKLDAAFKTRFGVHLAWPLSSSVRVGDIYVHEEGFYRPHARLIDHGIAVRQEPSPALELGFSSEQVRERLFVAGAEVARLPARQSGEARLELEFLAEDEFFLRSRPARSSRMRSPSLVAEQIADRVRDWNHLRWFVVTEVIATASYVLLASGGRGTRVDVRADTGTLARFLGGEVGVGIRHSSTMQLAIRVFGEGKGALGLRLARVRTNGALDDV